MSSQSLPIPESELAVTGVLAADLAEVIADLGPSPAELSFAREWLMDATPELIDAFSVEGDYTARGYAEFELSEHCAIEAEKAQEMWTAAPLSAVPADLMACSVVEALAVAGDDDPEAADWLWSPIGVPIRSNSARLTGERRHRAHMAITAEAANVALDIDRTYEAALQAAQNTAQRCVDNADRLGAARLAALDELDDVIDVATDVTPVTMNRLAEGHRGVFVATCASWTQLSVASCLDTDNVIDAVGWSSLLVRRLSDWSRWVHNVVNWRTSLVAEAPEAAEYEAAEAYACWSVADLLMRSRAYPSMFADDPDIDPVVFLAHDLLDRAFILEPT